MVEKREALSQEEFDELLAAELDMSVAELRDSELDLEPPWEAEIVRDHEELD